VPMRMMFTRVEKNMLPKAHGVSDKGSEITPDNVNLRTVVARMRAASGPDISLFQKSVNASDQREADGIYDASASAAELDRWARELRDADAATGPARASDSHLEPYRPDMLPGARPAPAAPDARIIRREPPTTAAPLARSYPLAEEPQAARPSLLRREGSLRESILRKPLSSLYDKD
jgi:uncharacterized protein